MTSDSLCKVEKNRQSNKQRQVVGEGCSEKGKSMCKGPEVGMCSAPWSSIEDAGVGLGGIVRSLVGKEPCGSQQSVDFILRALGSHERLLSRRRS